MHEHEKDNQGKCNTSKASFLLPPYHRPLPVTGALNQLQEGSAHATLAKSALPFPTQPWVLGAILPGGEDAKSNPWGSPVSRVLF